MRISINEDPRDDENYIVAAPYDQGQKAADCALVINDLNETISISEKILTDLEYAKITEGQPNEAAKATELKALWTAAVIGYTKCFNNGTRLPINPDIYDPHPGAREAHVYFLT